MFFKNNKTLIYIRRGSLELYNGEIKEELKFPQTIYQNIEILDLENFNKLLASFLSNLNFKKQSVVICFAEGILFSKEIVATSEDELNSKIQNFLDSLPLNKDKIATKKIIDGEKNFVFAANKKIYEAVMEVLDKLGWNVKAVIPISLFKDKVGMEDDEITTSSAKKILSEKKLIEMSDFLSDKEETIKHKSGIGLFLIASGFLLVIVTALLFAFRLKVLNFEGFGSKDEKSISENITQQESTESAQPESSESAKLEKESLKVQIFNGSGVVGQAARIRDQLVDLGYSGENIELGNATGSGETVVIFSNQVAEGVHDELITKLQESFEDVSIQDETEESEFDIIITTGKEAS